MPNKILIRHGRFMSAFTVTGETDLAIEIRTPKGLTWLPRKALKYNKDKIPFDGKYREPYDLKKWFYEKTPAVLGIFR